MSEKSKKPKDVDEFDDFPEEEVKEVKTEDKKAKSAKNDGIMAKANAMASSRKHGIDPIVAVSAIVLMLACVIVIGNTVYDNTIADHTEARVEYGDNIEVDYIGCFGTFYDADNPKNGAVIFDTSISTLNSEVPTSYEYNPGFKPLTFEVGKSTSLLSKFQNAVIGLRPGQTTTVYIPAADAYGELTDAQKNPIADSYTIYTQYTFTSTSEFKTVFGFDAPANGAGVKFIEAYTSDMDAPTQATPYGFAANVITDSNGTVTVTYFAEADKTYVMNDDVYVSVSAADEYTITYTYEIQKDKVAEEGKTLLKGYIDDQVVYIKVDENGDALYYKTTDEKTGEDLYFTITVLRYVEKSS